VCGGWAGRRLSPRFFRTLDFSVSVKPHQKDVWPDFPLHFFPTEAEAMAMVAVFVAAGSVSILPLALIFPFIFVGGPGVTDPAVLLLFML